MSLNISGTKFVRVYDTEIKLQVSDKTVFARLSTSRKTGKEQVDKETGNIVRGEDGRNAAALHGVHGSLEMLLSHRRDLRRGKLLISSMDGLSMSLTSARTIQLDIPLLLPLRILKYPM